MRVLNIEDSVFKQNDICKVIQSCGVYSIDKAENLEDGLGFVSRAMEGDNPYDLIITDMWYPRTRGGSEAQSGEELIKTMREQEIGIPIIVCSSVRYRIPDILGCVYYSEKNDWEGELRKLIEQVKNH